jgi:hypothetical protein
MTAIAMQPRRPVRTTAAAVHKPDAPAPFMQRRIALVKAMCRLPEFRRLREDAEARGVVLGVRIPTDDGPTFVRYALTPRQAQIEVALLATMRDGTQIRAFTWRERTFESLSLARLSLPEEIEA